MPAKRGSSKSVHYVAPPAYQESQAPHDGYARVASSYSYELYYPMTQIANATSEARAAMLGVGQLAMGKGAGPAYRNGVPPPPPPPPPPSDHDADNGNGDVPVPDDPPPADNDADDDDDGNGSGSGNGDGGSTKSDGSIKSNGSSNESSDGGSSHRHGCGHGCGCVRGGCCARPLIYQNICCRR